MITPYTKHILVTPDPEVDEHTTKSGIVYKDRYLKREEMQVHLRWGTVEAVGEETDPIKPGLRVVYNPFDAHVVPDGLHVIPIIGVRAYTA